MRIYPLSAEIIDDQRTPIGFHLKRCFVVSYIFIVDQIHSFNREFPANDDQRAFDFHPPLIVANRSGRRNRFVVVYVKYLDDLSVHLNGVRNPDIALQGRMQGLRNGGFPVACGPRQKETATGTGNQSKCLNGVFGKDKIGQCSTDNLWFDSPFILFLHLEHAGICVQRNRCGANIAADVQESMHAVPTTVKHGIAVVPKIDLRANFD